MEKARNPFDLQNDAGVPITDSSMSNVLSNAPSLHDITPFGVKRTQPTNASDAELATKRRKISNQREDGQGLLNKRNEAQNKLPKPWVGEPPKADGKKNQSVDAFLLSRLSMD